jgi:HD superfamily phosphohydrolase
MSFIILDPVYGKEVIDDPVLIELINSESVQRLKNLAQYGIPDDYYHKRKDKIRIKS